MFKWVKKIFTTKKQKHIEVNNPELKYYCNKCGSELSYQMYLENKCIWCDSKCSPQIVKEIDKTPKNLYQLHSILINSNQKSLERFRKKEKNNASQK